MIAVPDWITNFLVVAGRVWAYPRLPEMRRGDPGRLALAFILTTGFLAACRGHLPAALPLFRGLLHLRQPW
jgi:hypothetical protein